MGLSFWRKKTKNTPQHSCKHQKGGIKMKKLIVLIVFLTLWFFVSGNGPSANEGPSINVPDIPTAGGQKWVGKIKPSMVKDFGNIPLYFIPNRGQMDEAALFCARTGRYTLWVTKQGLVFDSTPALLGHPFQVGDHASPHSTGIKRDVSQLIFLKANKNPFVTAVEPAQHRVSFFKGNDQSRWRSHIPTSHAVYYQDIYKNIDLKIYGVEKQIEYDWVVKPGGDPGDIRFQYREVKGISCDEQGNLVVRTALGQWIHKKPSAYQEIGRSASRTGRRMEVEVKFKKTGENTYGFALGEYDKSCELIIDPMVVAYSTYLGGSMNEDLLDIAVDGTGAVIAVGYTYSSNFPTSGAYQGTLAGPSDAFISKFSPDGSSLVFSTYLGGSDHDGIKSIWLGSGGVIYVGGVTLSSDYPTVNPYQGFNAGGPQDGLISKLSADGSTLLYSTYLGGSGWDFIEGIAMCSSGEICVAGSTFSSDFPLQNAVITTYDGGGIENYGDAFVTKLSSSGGSLVYSTYLGKNGMDFAYAITVDSSGAAYVVGTTSCSSFPTIRAYQSTHGGGTDGFLTKFPANGNPLVFSTFLGGNIYESIFDVDLDSSDGIYVTGRTSSTNFPTTSGVFQTSKPGGNGTYDYDGFISRFTYNGYLSFLTFSTYLGGSGGITELHDITVDSSGAAFVTGFTESPNFPLQDAFHSQLDAATDAVVTELSTGGSGINFSSYLGSGNYAAGQAIAVNSGSIYLAGASSDSLLTYQAYQDTFGGVQDGFVTKIVYSPYSGITVTAPNGTEKWQVGSDENITWTAPATIKNVKIEYSSNSGTTWNTVKDSTPNTGAYTWTIPDTISANCLVSISDVESGYMSPDLSDEEFTIYSQSIDVSYPNGGEVFMQEDLILIQWTSTPAVTDVELYYSTDDGSTWNLIDGPISNSGNYDWVVPTIPSTQCLVKVKDAASTNEDISDAVFTIRAPSITVMAPNGGEVLMQESITGISWTHEGNIFDVVLSYSTDNGDNWTVIAGPMPNSGNYDWVVPPTPSSQCLVRVQDITMYAEDTSDAVFTIRAPSITVMAPNGGEVLMQDSITGISWTHEGNIFDVVLSYSTDNGDNWTVIAGPMPNSGTYDWLVPPTPSSQCLVRVQDVAMFAEDTSDAVFTIRAPSITVMAPNGGEVLMQDSMTGISWTHEGNIFDVVLSYSTDNGDNWTIFAGPMPNSGTYDWLVPPTPSSQCLVRVQDVAMYAEGTSDAVFTIRAPSITVIAPNGGEVLMQENMTGISWTHEGNISDVVLSYSTDNGNNWTIFAGPIPNSGTYDWLVPTTPSSQCLVRVQDVAMYAEDTSDAVFTIRPPSITVIAPNGGEILMQDNMTGVSWTHEGNIFDVVLSYSTDNGNNWTIFAGPIPNSGNYDWLVPPTPSSQCLVRVQDITMYAEDTSDAVFTIRPPSITVIAPNGSENWQVNTIQTINWTFEGNIQDVVLQYSTDSGSNWTDIAGPIANTGSYDWTVPNDPSSNCLVKVLDAAMYAQDTSDVEFTISPASISSAQRDTLIALYNSTNGNNWTNNTNWRLPGDPSQFNDPGTEHTWYGVTCSPDHAKVIEINLPSNFLNGTLPDLSALTQLTKLDLGDNQLTGALPAALNNLTNLQVLDLGANFFAGTLPDLSGLVNLTQLDLSTNLFDGNIPTWTSLLTALNTLNLSENQFTGSLPDLSGLTLLTEFNVGINQLSGTIPAWLNSLTALTTLNLGYNQFSGEIPDLSSLIQLTDLNLYANQLTGSIPTWIDSLTVLTRLDLSANQLTGTIPDLGSLTSLTHLYLSNNDLSGSIPDLSTLTSLEYIYLNNNRLSGSIPNISGLANLYRLDLSGNQLSGGIPSEIGTLTGLRYLLLHGNRLDGSLPSSLINLTNLIDNSSSIRWNALYTDDPGLRDFINTKQYTGNWESTQTIAPTGISAGEATVNSIKVSWTPVLYQSGSGGYRVYYSTTSGSGYQLAGTTADKTVTNYIVADLTPDTTYYFVVETFTDSHVNNQNTVVSEYSTEVSTATFETPTLTVIAPNGGQSWVEGTTQIISWTNTGTIANVDIEYSANGGESWNPIVTSMTNTGSYNWVIPAVDSTNCLVRVRDTATSASDVSDAVFTLWKQPSITVTAPNGGEVWRRSTNKTITWTTTGNIQYVRIQYSTNAGIYWRNVVSSTPNDGSCQWWIPNVYRDKTQCLVKIMTLDGTVVDTSR
jgi:Leucine-rich repeat (LRR) protein